MGRGMGVEGSMNFVLDISAAAGEFGAENWINYVLEKLREIGRAMSPEEWINFVREKLKEFQFLAVEQLKHWARVAAPYIVAAVAVVAFLIFLRYFIGCCCRVVRGGVSVVLKTMIALLRYFSCCCGRVVRGGGSAAKTMIAPGTGGAVRIPRASFEANPASYFRGLRGR